MGRRPPKVKGPTPLPAGPALVSAAAATLVVGALGCGPRAQRLVPPEVPPDDPVSAPDSPPPMIPERPHDSPPPMIPEGEEPDGPPPPQVPHEDRPAPPPPPMIPHRIERTKP